ncbi:hypothetical protein EDC94DRAFT_386949 [Helicostylum pulchrum]|nr:hypothetical protein EDC94DRAFT_386949 [Helicostylum pulchrum]
MRRLIDKLYVKTSSVMIKQSLNSNKRIRRHVNTPLLFFFLLKKLIISIMTLKRKRSLLTASDRRRRRVDPDNNPPAPNPVPEEPDDKVYKAFFNRKSKLATLLTPNYKVYENLFRKVAEEFTIARRDALNFVLFMVIQWFNTQCVELFAYQTQQVPQIQIYLRRILHETFLMNQLRDLVQQELIIPNQYENLLDLRAQIQNYLLKYFPPAND